jgi:hypothetical protein
LIAVNVVTYGTPTSAGGSGDCVVIAGALTMVTEKFAWLWQAPGPLMATDTLTEKVPPKVGVPLTVVLALKDCWRTMVVLVLAGLNESPLGRPEMDHEVVKVPLKSSGNVVVAVRVDE